MGRSRASDVVLEHPSVSGRHLEIRPGRTTELRDLDSKNGTWLGDRRVFRMAVLPGDVLCVGDCELRIERVEELDVELLAGDQFGEMFGASVAMSELFAELSRIARTDLGGGRRDQPCDRPWGSDVHPAEPGDQLGALRVSGRGSWRKR